MLLTAGIAFGLISGCPGLNVALLCLPNYDEVSLSAAMSKESQPKIDPLVIAISSRALFDLSDSHRVYEEEGLDAYQDYQITREGEPLEPGDAFSLVKKLLHLNDLLDQAPVEVILLSRNSADTGLRIFNSI